ncbi:MAG: TadE/TadG family type IV pilus assembly protein [Alphaproteobacteria bacterium]
MEYGKQIRRSVERFCSALNRFGSDARAVSAVEFALILPVMITIYLGSVDVTQILTADRKVTNVASSLADLVAQSTQISDSEVANIFDAATAIMKPLPTAGLGIIVTSVVVDNNDDVVVAWSEASNASAYTPGEGITLPTGIIEAGSSVIMAEVTYTYSSPVVELVAGGSIDLDDKFYLRPRRSLTVARVN